MIKGNFWCQIWALIIIDFFRANSSDLEWFECQFQKLTYGAFFPLNFHHWVGICDQLRLLVKTIEFRNTLCSNLINSKVNFKIPCLLTFFNFDWKFVFSDKSWVGKIPHTSIFGINTQIIPNQTSLREKKSITIHALIWCQKLPFMTCMANTNFFLNNV